MAQDTQSVPKWFSDYLERHDRWHADFAERNANEHGALEKAIGVAENRMTRWMLGGPAGAVTVILTGIGVATAIIAALINANGG